MALVRRDCIPGARGGTHFLKRMHDLTEDAGDQGSLLCVSDIPCPGHFLSVSLFLSCLYVSSSAPLCSFSHDALPHHRLRKKQFTMHQNCEPRGRAFPSRVAFLGISSLQRSLLTHTVGKRATTRPEEEELEYRGRHSYTGQKM